LVIGEKMEITVALIKPDAMKDGHMVDILREIQGHGLIIADMVKATWSRALVAQFYAEHRERDFFPALIDFMTSGPILAMTLVGADAVKRWRFLMGATDPKKAAPGTIRNLWGSKTGPIMWNCVHGSDSEERAEAEMNILRMAECRQGVPHFYAKLAPFGDEALRVAQASLSRCGIEVMMGKTCMLHEGHAGAHRHRDKSSESARFSSRTNLGPPAHLDEETQEEIENEEDTTTPIPESHYGVHAAHCCKVHGCKYETVEPARCPVEIGKIERESGAGWCQEPGLVDDPESCRREGEELPGSTVPHRGGPA
jgi:nucleoside-diphosphate kinase